MPRAGAGSGNAGRSSSGHDSSRMSSGHRPSMPGSGRRATGGAGFGGFDPGIGGGRGPSGDPGGSGSFDLDDLLRAAGAGMAGGYGAGRRSARRGSRYGAGSPYGRQGIPFPDDLFDAMNQSGRYDRRTGRSYGGPFGAGTTGPIEGPFGAASDGGAMGGPPMSQQNPFDSNGGKRPARGGLTGLMPLFGILAALAIFLVIFMMPSCSNSEPNRNDYNIAVPESTYNRTKLDSGRAYDPHCIDDELGWFENASSSEQRLKVFYEKTGIQPYILFAKYNPKLTTDEQKQQWAEQWYDAHIDNEDTLLFVYFAERDVDNDVGYMTLVNGRNTETIMDAQATEIFWTYLDEYWYSDRTTDDAIVAAFDSTADRIMTKTTTRNDVRKWTVIAVIVIGALAIGGVVAWMLVKRRREHEQYVERMVTTPLEEASDPILAKYDQVDPNDQVDQEQKGQ